MSDNFASGQHALGICDICGVRCEYPTMREVYRAGMPTNVMACQVCWDKDHPQNFLGRKPVYDPQALKNPRPDTSLASGRAYFDKTKLSSNPIMTGTSRLSVNDYEDGIHLDFINNVYYYKVPGALPVIGNTLSTVMNWTCGSEALIRGPAGTLVPTVTNVPKIQYDLYGRKLGLLIEPTILNKFFQTNGFDTGSWIKAQSSVTLDSSVQNPEGNFGTFLLKCDSTAANIHVLRQDSIVVSGTTYAFSFFVKPKEITQIQLGLDTAFGVAPAVVFTLTDQGTAVTVAGTPVDKTIEPFANGWYRCTIVATATSSTTSLFRLYQVKNNSASFDGNSIDGVYVYGAQLEAKGQSTSYIPCASSSVAVTRTADNCWRTVGSEFSQTAGTCVVHGVSSWFRDAPNGQFVYSFQKAATGFNDSIRFNKAANAEIERHGILTGGVGVTLDTGVFTPRLVFKTAFAWQATEQQVYSSNGSSVTGISLTLPTVDSFCLGTAAPGSDGANQLTGHIKSIRYYPSRKDNTFLQSAIVL